MLLTGSTAGSTAVWFTAVFFASYAAANMPPRIDLCLTSRPAMRYRRGTLASRSPAQVRPAFRL